MIAGLPAVGFVYFAAEVEELLCVGGDAGVVVGGQAGDPEDGAAVTDEGETFADGAGDFGVDENLLEFPRSRRAEGAITVSRDPAADLQGRGDFLPVQNGPPRKAGKPPGIETLGPPSHRSANDAESGRVGGAPGDGEVKREGRVEMSRPVPRRQEKAAAVQEGGDIAGEVPPEGAGAADALEEGVDVAAAEIPLPGGQ